LGTQLAAVRLKIIGRWLQAMVDVHRPDLAGPPLGAGHQQRGGVGATAQCHRKRKARAEISQGLFDAWSHVGQRMAHLKGYLPALVSVNRP
jgi:hypothetical protein